MNDLPKPHCGPNYDRFKGTAIMIHEVGRWNSLLYALKGELYDPNTANSGGR